jgi:hypothetical protein
MNERLVLSLAGPGTEEWALDRKKEEIELKGATDMYNRPFSNLMKRKSRLSRSKKVISSIKTVVHSIYVVSEYNYT